MAEVHSGGKNKLYQQARDEFGTAAENREAIELGRKAFREDSEVSVDTYKALTPAQQKLFRIGLRDSMRLALATKKPGDNATLLLQQRRIRELLSEVIPKPKGKAAEFADRPQRFGDLMAREERMSQTRNKVLGGSPTGERLADDAEFASDALSRVMTGGRSVMNFGLEIVGKTLQKTFGYRRDVAASIARKLVDTDPASRAQTLAAIKAQESPQAFSAFAEGLNVAIPRGAAATTPASQPQTENRAASSADELRGDPASDRLAATPQVPLTGDPARDAEIRAEWQRKTDERRDNALVRAGDKVLIPGPAELAGNAWQGLQNAGEAAMAFGPMGEALEAPIAGAGAVIKSFKAKPPAPTAAAPLTLDQEGQRVADVVRRRNEAAAAAKTAKEAADRKANGMTQTVPVVEGGVARAREKSEVLDDLQSA